MPDRVIYCEEALSWLRQRGALPGCSLVTSLPDVSETGLSLEAWRAWFTDAAELCLRVVPDEGMAIFFQTDVKKRGAWVDKGYLVHAASERAGMTHLWHKIVCRKPAGTITFGRPAYSHLQAYSRGLKIDLAHAFADVLPEAGEMSWSRAMGTRACLAACKAILDSTPTRTVVDPFCGLGTALAAANALGMDAIGVELSPKRARRAKHLQVSAEGVLVSSARPALS
jgi:hypothetical protein